jgi:hypothetical protein
MERLNFSLTDWYPVGNTVRDVIEAGLKYYHLSWNVLGLGGIKTRAWNNLALYKQEAVPANHFTKITWDCWQ